MSHLYVDEAVGDAEDAGEVEVEGEEEEGKEEEDEVSIPTDAERIEFKQHLESWVDLEKKIKMLKIAIKERIGAQEKLGPVIQTFMSKYHYTNVSTQQGDIRLATRSVKSIIKMKDIKKKLVELHGEDSLKIFEEGREVVRKQNLRMVIPKVVMNLKI